MANIPLTIKPISYIKTNAADMMKFVNEHQQPIVITQNGEAKAVLVDFESYQNMQNAFTLLNVFQLAETEHNQGQSKDVDTVMHRLRQKLASQT